MSDRLDDAVRELMKARSVLQKVNRAMRAEAEMNAAKHLTDEVLANPLASAVTAGLMDLEKAIGRLYEAPAKENDGEPTEEATAEEPDADGAAEEPGGSSDGAPDYGAPEG